MLIGDERVRKCDKRKNIICPIYVLTRMLMNDTLDIKELQKLMKKYDRDYNKILEEVLKNE